MTEAWNATDADFADEEILSTAAGTIRGGVLDEAKRLTEGDRNESYGSPVPNMQHIADIYNAITGQSVSARDVALMHQATKLARRYHNPLHRDSYVDNCAYAGIEFECALAEVDRAIASFDKVVADSMGIPTQGWDDFPVQSEDLA